MSPILPKHQMSEEDIKLNYITPAILSRGWRDKITMETKVAITDGKINLKGNFIFRESPKRADYILYLSDNNPIAIIEAKYNNHSISHGLQQAMTYGPEFKNLIQVHHIVPIHTIGADYRVDPGKDLIPVCPNCHMILHSKVNGKEPSLAELRANDA